MFALCALAWTLLAGGVAPRDDAALEGRPRAVGLARVRRTFREIDRDGSAELDWAECEHARVPRTDFDQQDVDRDGHLSPEEFVMYYRKLLVKAMRPIAEDLVREAARIQALRRARRELGGR